VKKTYLIAAIIIGVISLWMFSGVIFPSNKHEVLSIEEQTATDKPPVKVRAMHIKAKQQFMEVVLMGKTEAKRVVDIKAEIGGRVISTPVEKGQRVKAGDVLCALAEDDRQVQLTRAKAAFDKAQIDFDGALRLQKDGLISSSAIAANKSSLEIARANMKVAEINVEHLTMRAPFAGFVEERPAQVGALIDRNGICAQLLDEASLLATGQVSERDVHVLQLGQPVKVVLVDGQILTGKIRFIGRTAHPETRTYTVEAELELTNKVVRDGVTAKIIVPLNQVLAHHISPAVMALDDTGNVGVRIVNAENRVEFHHVQVVKETTEGVWITGLPEEVNLITVGQELVADGDVVEPVFLDALKK
jgi:multidrug efflux system membrane fusion protein